ncbi:Mov34/MPN/PAD-1 family protein [Halorarum halobium]|uniref:Mov34/MPN/PAD-1 family protein n=1 Tax=Halorarum halobium TaxID=3075121 RepID=UPI0028A9D5BA|nr:Mov34/MPN/PAD-1 family protein [Halobaculum sp. XH14]
MRLFRSGEVLGIAAETLEFALEAASETHPNEYMGFLRGTDASTLNLARDGTVITDVLVIPGTTSSPESATVRENLVPNGAKAVGSIHSHPNGVLRPSNQDLSTFHAGDVHVIMGAPYERDCWKAFDSKGEPRDLDVLNVAIPDDSEFFDFDQSDIDAELYE